MEEVLEELGRDVLVNFVVPGQFERNAHKIQRIHRHPTGAIRLIDESAGRQRCTAVEHANIVQAQEAALENVPALRVLAIHPPGKIQHELWKTRSRNARSPESSGLCMRRCLRSIWKTRHVAHA